MAGIIVGFVILLFGAVFFIVGLVAAKRAKAALTWPVMPGVVLNARVVEHVSTDSEGDRSVTYEPLVEYQYNVMGQTYSATRIAFGANRFNYKKAAEIVARYPAGSQVSVHYNPDKVKDAVLETSAAGGKVFTILGAVLGGVGFIVMVVSLFFL